MSYLIRNAHFLVIHIPIAMLLFSFVFDLLALMFKKKDWHTAGLLCLIVGTLGAIAAVATGPEGERNPLFPQHELFGKITMILAILLTLVRLGVLWRKKIDIGKSFVYLLVMLVGVGLLSYTGDLGGKMVHPDRSQVRKGPGQQQGGFNQDNAKRPSGGSQGSIEGSH
ncbi:DUF2231 domain-containing protein [Paenibacillus cremeus]|uniref:DUF2231 domain-containing protein n=1 Tax=Paenibacillus cremeus TaxID=2163881 RepID=A0A559K6Y7_9BACL|nr:DUF2231 domain-containing protein [Paenibacillus cremeus]TVY07877.1 hypothetical protein FPZ49_21445 [Paenibacillus cremeus]